MARPLKLNNKAIKSALTDVRNLLTITKSTTGQFQFTYALPKVTAEATLRFTDTAWKKLNALVAECDKEIAWHGVVTKTANVYCVEDILVFPQTVTAATVTSDETEYSLWLANQPDEVFNKLRFHGHSHVNMGTSPSGVDTQYQEDMLKNVKDFYIFAIFNKKGANWCTIYDVEDNIVYEDADITLDTPDTLIEVWAAEQIAQQVKTVTTVANSKKKNTKTTTTAATKTYAEEVVDSMYDKAGQKYPQYSGYPYYGGDYWG